MEFKRALEKCMHVCSQREYCIGDIKEKLKKWEITSTDQGKIISQLLAEKFIDHNRYTPAFISDKFNFNHWGRIKITYYLKQKGIEKDIIETHLNKIDCIEYKRILKIEIDKKAKGIKGNNDFEKNQKIARYAISKGFEPNLVFELLKLD